MIFSSTLLNWNWPRLMIRFQNLNDFCAQVLTIVISYLERDSADYREYKKLPSEHYSQKQPIYSLICNYKTLQEYLILNQQAMALAKDPGSYGGRGGSSFDDGTDNVRIVGIRTVKIRAGDQVDSIQVDYVISDGSIWSSPRHGGWGGRYNSFTLESDEYIWKVEGKTNKHVVDQLTFHVKNAAGDSKSYGPYGRTGNTPFSKEGKIVAFHGGAGGLLDRIGFYDLEDFARTMKKSEKYGGNGGYKFDDYDQETGIIGIQSIKIRSTEDQVDSIQTTYRLANGEKWTSGRHGGSGGVNYSFSLGEGDYLSKIEGKTDGSLVKQLTFTVTKDNTSETTHGPFGTPDQDDKLTSFSIEGNIIAFFGSAGLLLDSFGFHFYEKLSKSERAGYKNDQCARQDPNSIATSGPGLKISKLSIVVPQADYEIIGIITEYITLGGTFVYGRPRIGAPFYKPSDVIDIGMDEVLIKVEGTITNHRPPYNVTFTMKNTKGQIRTAGPFGGHRDTGPSQIAEKRHEDHKPRPFSFSAPNGIQGFFGEPTSFGFYS